MLRRRTPSASPEPAAIAVDLAKPGGKGRATPKRSESQKQRKQAVRPPANNKEARVLARAKLRDERLARTQGLKRGDERSLPARDRGAVRRFVRDVVDSRLNVAEFFVVIVPIVILGTLVIRPLAPVVTPIWAVALVGVVIDSFLLRSRIRRMVSARFPDAPTKGLVAYGVMRSLQFRRLRLPKPQVKRGAAIG